jgi:hypothetical protein
MSTYLIRHVQKFQHSSRERTKIFLESQQVNLVELSIEQKEKLMLLEKDMMIKKKQKDQGKKLAEDTGIPLDVVTFDVVRLAMTLGLIKSKAIREGKLPDDKKPNLLEMFLGKNQNQTFSKHKFLLTDIPLNFSQANVFMLEEEKLFHLQEQNRKEFHEMEKIVNIYLEKNIQQIKTKIGFHPETCCLEDFRKEAMSFFNDTVDSLCEEDVTIYEKNLMIQDLNFLRKFIIGIVDIITLQQLLTFHVKMMKDLNISTKNIQKSFTFFEAVLILFPDFHLKIPRRQEIDGILFNLQINSFFSDVSFVPFQFATIKKKLDTLLYLIVHVKDIVQFSLLKAQNNCIGFLPPLSFFLLKRITVEKVRLWCLDPFLFHLRQKMKTFLNKNLISLFRLIHFETFQHNVFSSHIFSFFVFRRLIKNLVFINSRKFDIFLQSLIRKYAQIVPTEHDFFNAHQLFQEKEPIISTCVSRQTILSWLFDNFKQNSLL